MRREAGSASVCPFGGHRDRALGDGLLSPATEVLILFGSNVEPRRNARAAAGELTSVLDSLVFSSAWLSPAIGSDGAPQFVNWVARGFTSTGPAELKFDLLRPIEYRLGRRRSADLNAPRTADLDVLLYGELVLSRPNAGIELPGPELESQAYALIPAAEVAPAMEVPGTGYSIAELAAEASSEGLEVLGPVMDLTDLCTGGG